MTRSVLKRILVVGVLHMAIYGLFLPVVIYPRFGKTGSILLTLMVLVFTILIMTGFRDSRKSQEITNDKS